MRGAGTIVRTSDGGNSWVIVPSGTTENLKTLSFVNATTGWVLPESSFVHKSTDGGLTWSPQALPIDTELRTAFFVDENTGWIAAGSLVSNPVDAVILKTVDGGDTWDSRSTAFTVRTMFFVDALNGWIAGGLGFVAVTRDGGKIWDHLDSGTNRNIPEVYFLDANNGWLVARIPGTIATTSDGGTTWRFQTNPSDLNLSDVAFVDANTGWICGFDGLILKTVTGGW